jgi:Omp85 superfamily domain
LPTIAKRSSPFLALLLSVLCGRLAMPAIAQEPAATTAGGTFECEDPSPTAEASATSCQDENTPANAPNDQKNPTDAQIPEKRTPRGSFVFAPLPISSPAIGTGIIPVVAYIFPFTRRDKVSPPSTIAVAGLFTNNGSQALAFGAQLYFGQGRYKATAAYARGNLNYDIYGPGVLTGLELKLPLKQTGEVYFGEFMRRIWWDFFLGPRFFDGSSVITLRPSDVEAISIPPNLGFSTDLRSIGLRLQRDTRPNQFYPAAGTLTDFKSDFFTEAIGSKYSFQSYELTFNKYVGLTKNQVVAASTYFCGVGGHPPFYGNCIYGARNQLRGYTPGRYLDRYMGAAQIEYRLALPKRLGLVGFGGIGGVIPGEDQFLIRRRYFLPSAGCGLRFMLSKAYHVNLRADIAEGRDGHTFAMGMGEAF